MRSRDSAILSLACLHAHISSAVVAEAIPVIRAHLPVPQLARIGTIISIANLRPAHIACVGVWHPGRNIRAGAHTVDVARRARGIARGGRTANTVNAVTTRALIAPCTRHAIGLLWIAGTAQTKIAAYAVVIHVARRPTRRAIANEQPATCRPVIDASAISVAKVGVCLDRTGARLGRTLRTNCVFCASPRTITHARLLASRNGIHHAFIVGIGIRGNRLALAVRLRRFGTRARFTRARTRGVAANAIGAETARALIRSHTRRPVVQFWRAVVHARAIIPGCAIGVGGTGRLARCPHTDKRSATRRAAFNAHARAITYVGIRLGGSGA